MIQPGKETNLPNNSGTIGLQGMFGSGGLMGASIAKLDGFTVTVGLVVLIVVGFLLWQMMTPKKRR